MRDAPATFLFFPLVDLLLFYHHRILKFLEFLALPDKPRTMDFQKKIQYVSIYMA